MMTADQLRGRHEAAVASMNAEQLWALTNVALSTNMACCAALSEDVEPLDGEPLEVLFRHIANGSTLNTPPQ